MSLTDVEREDATTASALGGVLVLGPWPPKFESDTGYRSYLVIEVIPRVVFSYRGDSQSFVASLLIVTIHRRTERTVYSLGGPRSVT